MGTCQKKSNFQRFLLFMCRLRIPNQLLGVVQERWIKIGQISKKCQHKFILIEKKKSPEEELDFGADEYSVPLWIMLHLSSVGFEYIKYTLSLPAFKIYCL